MESWASALINVLRLVDPLLALPESQWAVVGSVATALQGVDIAPNDLDILARRPEVVFRFVEGMAPYTPEHVESSPDHEDWQSSQEMPVSEGLDDYGFYWTFARWFVDGVKVEIAHIQGPEGMATSQPGDGIWEAGPEIWAYVRHASFRDHRVPVVPLEIQLETCLQRDLTQRADAILGVLQYDGYDEALLKRSLRPEHLTWFEQRRR